MNLIAAVDKNWAIGYKNGLLVRIPADMKLFRQETAGKAVIMGRTTLESLPSGQPLAGRKNIVLTKRADYAVKGAEVVHSVEEALAAVREYRQEDVYCIGGESVYRQFLPYCNTAHITFIDFAYQADRYFPNLDQSGEWKLVCESDEHTYYDLEYYFRKYIRNTTAACEQ